MGALAVICFTIIWAVIGCGGPWVVPKGPNRGLFQTMVIMSSVCCYTFWLLAYMHQMNPLIGPGNYDYLSQLSSFRPFTISALSKQRRLNSYSLAAK